MAIATQTLINLLTIAANHVRRRFGQSEAALAKIVYVGVGSPAYSVVYAGTHTTTGGSATEAKTVTGVLSTDILLASLKVRGATPRTILTAAPTTNTVTYVFSGDPSTDHQVYYTVLRAVPAT